MIDFTDAYILWRAHPFPGVGIHPLLTDVRSDIALGDTYVMTVIQFVERGIYSPAVPDVLGFLEAIRARLDGFDSEDQELKANAAEQRAYCALQWVLYERFLALKPSTE